MTSTARTCSGSRIRLSFLAASGKTPQKIALRARIILLAADGTANHAIAGQLGISRPTVLLWRDRFEAFGVPGLMKERKRSGRPSVRTPEKVKQVVEATIHFHFTPTSSSWLNMVERWFGEITRKRIRRGVFHSVPELIAAIETYLAHNNENPKIFTWTKDADTILAKIQRCKASAGTAH